MSQIERRIRLFRKQQVRGIKKEEIGVQMGKKPGIRILCHHIVEKYRLQRPAVGVKNAFPFGVKQFVVLNPLQIDRHHMGKTDGGQNVVHHPAGAEHIDLIPRAVGLQRGIHGNKLVEMVLGYHSGKMIVVHVSAPMLRRCCSGLLRLPEGSPPDQCSAGILPGGRDDGAAPSSRTAVARRRDRG